MINALNHFNLSPFRFNVGYVLVITNLELANKKLIILKEKKEYLSVLFYLIFSSLFTI
jgi:hypothetical protein